MERDEQIDHCRRLNPSFSHANFSEIASFRVLFSRSTRLTASCVTHSSDTEIQSPACSDAVDFCDQGGCQSQEMAFLYEHK
jgi:hypothetical protein